MPAPVSAIPIATRGWSSVINAKQLYPTNRTLGFIAYTAEFGGKLEIAVMVCKSRVILNLTRFRLDISCPVNIVRYGFSNTMAETRDLFEAVQDILTDYFSSYDVSYVIGEDDYDNLPFLLRKLRYKKVIKRHITRYRPTFGYVWGALALRRKITVPSVWRFCKITGHPGLKSFDVAEHLRTAFTNGFEKHVCACVALIDLYSYYYDIYDPTEFIKQSGWIAEDNVIKFVTFVNTLH
jgi:hypothetical protein